MIHFFALHSFYKTTIAKYERLILEARNESERQFRVDSLENYRSRLNVLMQ